MFRGVWGLLLGLAIMFAVNPILLAVIVLMISRPRPVQNLLAYWLGSMIVSLAGLLIPLMILHLTASSAFSRDLTSPGPSSAGRYVQLGMGVLMLSIAAVLAVRSVRERARQSVPAGGVSAPVEESDTSNPLASPFGKAQDAAAEGGSVFRRLLRRLQNAWDDGALWVAFVFGLGGLPPPMLVIFVVTPIMASGAPVATQILAVILFVIGMFAVVEITLVSYLIAPEKTLAVLRPLHDWALAHRRQMLIVIFGIVGVVQIVNGIA